MEYIYGIEFKDVLLSIIIGITISSILYEKRGILTGGIIIPSIISLFIDKIIYVVSTMLMVVILHFMVSETKKHIILYGRRMYSVVILMGVGLVLLTRIGMDIVHMFGCGLYLSEDSNQIVLPFLSFDVPEYLIDMGLGMHYYGYVIGLLMVPIIVNDTQTQGLSKTIVALLSVAFLTYMIVYIIP